MVLEADDVTVAGFADERCRMVDRLFREGKLDRPTLRNWLALAWLQSEWPQEALPADKWLTMFRAAGFVTNTGDAQPTEPLTIYRACETGRERRMTWTTQLRTARVHADHWRLPEMWRTVVPPDAVLAWFRLDGGHSEVLIDPSHLACVPPWAEPVRME